MLPCVLCMPSIQVYLFGRASARTCSQFCLALEPEHEEARLTQVARSTGPVTTSTAAISDSAFADLLEFVQARPGADAPPTRVIDASHRPLANILMGAAAFFVGFLIVRFTLIG